MHPPILAPLVCPHCSSNKVVNFGAKRGQKIVDLPSRGQANHVVIDRKRYRCNECGKTFLEQLKGIDEKRKISLRLISYIVRQSLHRSFHSIANDVGLNEGTIRSIFKEYLARLEEAFSPATPKVLSFDEITIVNKLRYMVGNFELHTIIGILPDTSAATVFRYLEQLPDKDNVKAVVIDMDSACRDAVREYLAHAKIVVNPGNIDNTLLCKLEKLRQTTRERLSDKDLRLLAHDREIIRKHLEELTDQDKERLSTWENRFKKLVFAYWRKEELRIILKEGSKEEAMEQCLAWQKNVLADAIKEYFPVIDQIFDWQQEVFGWMELSVHNRDTYFAYIIGLRDALLNHLDRSYSFDAVKAAILQLQSPDTRKGIKLNKVIWNIANRQDA